MTESRSGENGAIISGDEVRNQETEFSLRAQSRWDRGPKAVRRCGCGQREDN